MFSYLSFTNIFDQKIFRYLCFTFQIFLADLCRKFLKYLMENYCWKEFSRAPTQNQGNLISLQNHKTPLESSSGGLNEPEKLFITSHFWIGNKFLSSKYLLCINKQKVNVSIFSPFPSAMAVKTIFCAPQSSFCAENEYGFCYRSLFLLIDICLCNVMLAF